MTSGAAIEHRGRDGEDSNRGGEWHVRKIDYLSEPPVVAFLDFLNTMLVPGFPDVVLRVGPPGKREEVGTLVDVWLSSSGRDPLVRDRVARRSMLRRDIGDCLERCAAARRGREQHLTSLELRYQALKALKLTGVFEESCRYLLERASRGDLRLCLTEAAALIDADEADLRQLASPRLRYDFGLSSVYAAVNGRTVIYDDRLGAALGLLCRLSLERRFNYALPMGLAFMVGSGERDPSAGRFRFDAPRPGPALARWNTYASWILEALAANPRVRQVLRGTHAERMVQIETALWILGDNVADQVHPDRRRRRAARRHGERRLEAAVPH